MRVAGDRRTARGILWRAFKRPPCLGSIFVQLLGWRGPSLPLAPHIPAIASLSQELAPVDLGGPRPLSPVVCPGLPPPQDQAKNWRPQAGVWRMQARCGHLLPLDEGLASSPTAISGGWGGGQDLLASI